MPPRYQVFLLGTFSIVADGRPLRTLNAAQLQALLAFLLLHPGIPQNRGHLAALFWPDLPTVTARANLRKILYKLMTRLPGTERCLEMDSETMV